jgi:hypothetical protein
MTATCVTRLAASARGQADVRPRYIEAPPAPIQPGAVRRSLLIERLAKDGACPIVSVAAPPGYGKTTLLTQWAEHSAEAFAWVSIDERDNDPKVLLTYIAETLNAIEPIVLSWMTCTSWTTGSARLRCRCLPIMCRAVRGWCWEAGPNRRCASHGRRAEGRILEIGQGSAADLGRWPSPRRPWDRPPRHSHPAGQPRRHLPRPGPGRRCAAPGKRARQIRQHLR